MNRCTPCDGIESILHVYGDMLWRIARSLLSCAADAEDAIQETLLAYSSKRPRFKNPEHEKAWLIRVLTNKCRDIMRKRSRPVPATIPDTPPENSQTGILEALACVPEKYRIVLVLHYVEGYTTNEIAAIIHRTPSAVKMRLGKGRSLLEEIYRREYM